MAELKEQYSLFNVHILHNFSISKGECFFSHEDRCDEHSSSHHQYCVRLSNVLMFTVALLPF